jgi:hypothetical protein
MGIIRDNAIENPFTNPQHESWRFLVPRIFNEGWNLEPDYQRKSCWTENQQRAFIAHVLEGNSVPPIYAHRPPLDAGVEIIDGQQRLRAVLAFVRGGLKVTMPYGVIVGWEDLDRADQVLAFSSICWTTLDRADRLKWYLRLNAGVPHPVEELDRVRGLLTLAGSDPTQT